MTQATQDMEFDVRGMTCGGCEASVVRAVQKVTGVVEARADHRAGRVHVRALADVEPAAVRGRIEGAGYDVIGGP